MDGTPGGPFRPSPEQTTGVPLAQEGVAPAVPTLETSERLKNLAETRLYHARADALRVTSQFEAAKLSDFEASADQNRHFTFVGDVNLASAVEATQAVQHWARQDPGREIRIDLNTPGGSLSDGLALYDAIREAVNAGTPVRTHAVGSSLSMGAVLLQAGSSRTISPNAYLMVHVPSAGQMGSLFELEDSTTLLRDLKDRVVGILAERSHLSVEEIEAKWQRRDWWLNADEALEAGFVDEVTD